MAINIKTKRHPFLEERSRIRKKKEEEKEMEETKKLRSAEVSIDPIEDLIYSIDPVTSTSVTGESYVRMPSERLDVQLLEDKYRAAESSTEDSAAKYLKEERKMKMNEGLPAEDQAEAVNDGPAAEDQAEAVNDGPAAEDQAEAEPCNFNNNNSDILSSISLLLNSVRTIKLIIITCLVVLVGWVALNVFNTYINNETMQV